MDGDPRVIGTAPDIGSDELLQAPTLALAAVSAIGETTATLNATVNPNARETTYAFAYGPTAVLGATTPQRTLAATVTAQAIAEPLTGLTPDTTYSYRLTATNEIGERSVEGTFHTSATPPPPTTTTTTTTTTPTTAPPPTTTQGGAVTGTGTGMTTVTTPVAPTLTGLRVMPKSFARGKLLPRVAKTPVGTRIRFTLSQDAVVTFSFDRTVAGRRVNGSCRTATRKLRSRPACTRYLRAGTLKVTARAGARALRFQGRLNARKALTPARYRLTATAVTSAGLASKPATAIFTLLAASR